MTSPQAKLAPDLIRGLENQGARFGIAIPGQARDVHAHYGIGVPDQVRDGVWAC